MAGNHTDDWDGTPDELFGQSEQAPGPRRRSVGRYVAPLVLLTAGALLLVALIAAVGTLRTPTPQTATLEPLAAPTAPATPGTSPGTPASGSPTSGATGSPRESTGTSGSTSTAGGDAADQLKRIAAEHESRPQGQVYAILFDLADGADDPYLKTESGSSTWRAEDILWLYKLRAAAWPGAILEARTEGTQTRWRLTVSNPQWRTAGDAQAWCDASFSQYDGAARGGRCRVP